MTGSWFITINAFIQSVNTVPVKIIKHQSELIGQCQATPHHLSDVRRGAPS